MDDNLCKLFKHCSEFNFKAFKYTEYCSNTLEAHINPDSNFYNTVSNECMYYTNEQFSNKVDTAKRLSIIQFNCRSSKSNYVKLQEYLANIENMFDNITLSETWLDSNNSFEDYKLIGYQIYHMDRTSKGGGVAIYVTDNLACKVLPQMSTVIDKVLECITVELSINNKENIIITSWYSKPGSSIDICIDTLEGIFRNTKQNMNIFLCGDFNINLLNQDMNKGTVDFTDQLFRLGLYLVILQIYLGVLQRQVQH